MLQQLCTLIVKYIQYLQLLGEDLLPRIWWIILFIQGKVMVCNAKTRQAKILEASDCLQVKMCVCTCDDDCKVKAVCLPEMKKDHTYSVFVTISITSCNVKTAECSCK